MPENTSIQLVVFDLGGVMVRLAGRWKVACAHASVPCPAVLDDPATLDAIRDQVDPSERGHIDNREFIRRVAEIVGLTEEQTDRVGVAWLVGPYPGIEDLVDQLAGNGLQLGCLSNTNDRHWALMNGEGNAASLPMHRLHHRFASHLIGRRKPEPGIYEHVEQQTGIDPACIVFFDDNAPNVEAAQQRGWQAFTIDPERPVEQMTEHLRALRCL